MFNKLFDIGVPEYNLVGYFWENLRNDITGRGCLSLDIPPALIGLKYVDRARIERKMLQKDALAFLKTMDFIDWADLSGADPQSLKEELLYEYRLNS